MSTRDPRKDPRPGDVVRLGKVAITVESNFHHWTIGYREKGVSHFCTIDMWKQSTSNAEVLHAAD